MGHIAGAILGAIFGFTRATPSQNARPLGRLVNWTFDHFWLLAGILSAVAIVLALIMVLLTMVS